VIGGDRNFLTSFFLAFWRDLSCLNGNEAFERYGLQQEWENLEFIETSVETTHARTRISPPEEIEKSEVLSAPVSLPQEVPKFEIPETGLSLQAASRWVQRQLGWEPARVSGTLTIRYPWF